jgi:hypothetical protein
MLLSTSLAHSEAAYKWAGSIPSEVSGFSEEMSEAAAVMETCWALKANGKRAD